MCKISISEIKRIDEELPPTGKLVVFCWKLDFTPQLEAYTGYVNSKGQFVDIGNKPYSHKPEFWFTIEEK